MKGTEKKENESQNEHRHEKILVDNLNIGDIFRLKHELGLSNEKICELFDI